MSTRANCESCGAIEIEASRYSVGVDPALGRIYYGFECPQCGRQQRRGATPQVVTILLAVGARLISPVPHLSSSGALAFSSVSGEGSACWGEST